MNISSTLGAAAAPGEAAVFGNWSSSSPPIMPFAALQQALSSHKQFCSWSCITHNGNHQNHHDILPPYSPDSPTSIDFSCPSSSFLCPAPSVTEPAAAVFAPLYPQIAQLPDLFLRREVGSFDGDLGSQGEGRIGLNLGHRTYFSDRLLRRSRGFYPASLAPKCQAEGCRVDLTNAKHYHRRHRVCEIHSKAARVVLSGGLEQRFCQQCSRFHALTEFDEVKRSCRKRLADHNRRRRKPQPKLTASSPVRKPSPHGLSENQETEEITAESSCALVMARDNKAGDQELQQHEQKAVVTHLQKRPDLSLSGFEFAGKSPGSQITPTHQALSSPSSSSFEIEPTSPCSYMLDSHQYHRQPEDLQNLLQLVHSMFAVDDHNFL